MEPWRELSPDEALAKMLDGIEGRVLPSANVQRVLQVIDFPDAIGGRGVGVLALLADGTLATVRFHPLLPIEVVATEHIEPIAPPGGS